MTYEAPCRVETGAKSLNKEKLGRKELSGMSYQVGSNDCSLILPTLRTSTLSLANKAKVLSLSN